MVNPAEWDNIENIYCEPNFSFVKGSIIMIKVEIDGDIEEFDKHISTKTFMRFGEYSCDDKTIKPFKLMYYERNGNAFQVVLQVVDKSDEIDEVKLLCRDVIDIYNHENIHLLKWTNMIISE